MTLQRAFKEVSECQLYVNISHSSNTTDHIPYTCISPNIFNSIKPSNHQHMYVPFLSPGEHFLDINLMLFHLHVYVLPNLLIPSYERFFTPLNAWCLTYNVLVRSFLYVEVVFAWYYGWLVVVVGWKTVKWRYWSLRRLNGAVLGGRCAYELVERKKRARCWIYFNVTFSIYFNYHVF